MTAAPVSVRSVRPYHCQFCAPALSKITIADFLVFAYPTARLGDRFHSFPTCEDHLAYAVRFADDSYLKPRAFHPTISIKILEKGQPLP